LLLEKQKINITILSLSCNTESLDYNFFCFELCLCKSNNFYPQTMFRYWTTWSSF